MKVAYIGSLSAVRLNPDCFRKMPANGIVRRNDEVEITEKAWEGLKGSGNWKQVEKKKKGGEK